MEDSQGLWMQGLIDPNHRDARSVLRLIQSGSADGLSIGFRALDATPRQSGGRILKTIDLREVSVVTFPMLPRARLRLRADQSNVTPTTLHQSNQWAA
jgi:HK97 family phage prohead protease